MLKLPGCGVAVSVSAASVAAAVGLTFADRVVVEAVVVGFVLV
jgi:hypothetical protein